MFLRHNWLSRIPGWNAYEDERYKMLRRLLAASTNGKGTGEPSSPRLQLRLPPRRCLLLFLSAILLGPLLAYAYAHG